MGKLVRCVSEVGIVKKGRIYEITNTKDSFVDIKDVLTGDTSNGYITLVLIE